MKQQLEGSFNKLINSVAKNGNVAIIGCNAGQGIGMVADYNGGPNVYMNLSLSHGGVGDVDPNGKLIEYFPMNTPLNASKSAGWINVSTQTKYQNMVIGSNGTINPVK